LFREEEKLLQSDDTRWVGDMREEEIMEIVCYNSHTEEKTKKKQFSTTRERNAARYFQLFFILFF